MRPVRIALSAVLVAAFGFTLNAAPSPASALILYAYADGNALSPTSCPDVGTAATATGCSLASALSLASNGGTVALATPATDSSYEGVFDIPAPATAGRTISIIAKLGLPALPKLVGDSSGATILTIESGANVVVDHMIFSNTASSSTPPSHGGAINNAGTLQINNSSFVNNNASDGGAIDNADGVATGSATITNSTFVSNQSVNGGTGGAIDSADNGGAGSLNVSQSFFYLNRAAVYDGGAIDSGDDTGNGTLVVSDSAFAGNSATLDGGAIASGDFGGRGTTVISNTLFNSNSVQSGSGGSVVVTGSAVASIYNTTIVGSANVTANTPEALSLGSTTAQLQLAGNLITDQCTLVTGSQFSDLGYNDVADPSCQGNSPATTDVLDSNLATELLHFDTTGTVQFIRPADGSTAVGVIPSTLSLDIANAGTVALCPRLDIRGLSTPTGAACAAGSVNVANQPTIAITSLTGNYGTPLPLTHSGGAGTGRQWYSIASGSTATGCAIAGTAQQPTLVSTSIGNCSVVLNIDSDPQYQGASTDLVHITIAAAEPSVPRNVVATQHNSSATITWSAPTSSGGVALSGYKVTAHPLAGGSIRMCSSRSTSCTITGLTNAKPYRFQVTASNSVGPSVVATSNVVVIGTPSAPRITKVTTDAKHAKATVAWAPPAQANGKPVLSYQVAWSSNGGKSFGSWTSVGTNRSATRQGLHKGTAYAFEARAVNASGAGTAITKAGIRL